MKRRRYLIGLTGNIATGKSLVAQMLAELGARHLARLARVTAWMVRR